MKDQIKSLLKKLAPRLYAALRRRRRQMGESVDSRKFSEADLISRFFDEKVAGVMLDVGVHFGESFRSYSSLDWKILGFEPDASNRVKIPADENLILHDLAVSDVDGRELEFYVSEESSGISGLIPFRESHTTSYKVKTVTLRTIVERYDLKEIDFLKIDTEGNDLLVLNGHPFEIVKPKVILCEFEDSKTKYLDYVYGDMGDFLLGHGYKVYISEWYPVERYGVSHKWRSIRDYESGQRIQDPNGWGNFIAVRVDLQGRFEKVLTNYKQWLEL